MLGVPTGLMLTSPLALIACGGGGGGGDEVDNGGGSADPDQARAQAIAATLPPLARSVVAANVTLPAGIAATLTSVRLVTANNVSQVGDNGNAGVVVASGAPQMSYVIDAEGRVLLMSVIEAGVRTTVDSRGSAEALLALSTEAYNQGPAVELALRRALADTRFDRVVEPVRLAVEAAAARNGIDPDDTALMDALKTATLALRGKSAVPASAGRVQTQAVSLVPGGAESGVTVMPTDDFNTVQLQNQFRRRTHAWISRTGSYDAAGSFTPVAPAVPLTDFALDATAALSFDSLVTSVGDYVTEFYADLGFLGYYEASPAVWQPVSSAPIQLPFAPDGAEVSVYSARVVGVGATLNGPLTDAENSALDAILWTTLSEDIVKPFVRTLILPMISERVSATWTPTFEQAGWAMVLNGITDLSSLAVAGTYFPATVAALRAGDALAAFSGFLTEFFSSNTFQGLLELGLKAYTQAAGNNLTPQLLDSKGNVIGVNLVAGDLGKFDLGKLKNALGKLARIIQLIKVGTLVGDYAAIAKDWTSSARLAEFAMNISKAQVTLSPKPLQVVATGGAEGKGTVTAKVEGLDGNVPAGSVFLSWTCTAKYGNLYRVGGAGVDTFESLLTDPSHDYIPTGVADDPANPDVVTVTAFYRNATTNQRIEMGSARTTVEFRKEFSLRVTPLSAQLQGGGSMSVSARLVEVLPAGASVRYEWTLKSGGGSLATPPADPGLATSRVDYQAPSGDTTAVVQVSATVTLAGGRTTKTNPASTTITVKKDLKTLTVEGNWVYEPSTKPLAAPSCFIDGAGKEACHLGYLDDWVVYQLPKVAGALSYDIRLLDAQGGVRYRYGYPNGNSSSSIVDAGGLLRIRYWAADGPYGSYDGVSNYPQTEANAMAYLLSRVASDAPRIVATVTLPG